MLCKKDEIPFSTRMDDGIMAMWGDIGIWMLRKRSGRIDEYTGDMVWKRGTNLDDVKEKRKNRRLHR